MKQTINAFYVLNLLSALDGEILESRQVDISKYVELDVSTVEAQGIIVDELLKPELACFSAENQEKIRISMVYCIENYGESEWETLLNFYSGSVFPIPNTISYKQLLQAFYTGVFLKNVDSGELEGFRFFDNDNPESWNLYGR